MTTMDDSHFLGPRQSADPAGRRFGCILPRCAEQRPSRPEKATRLLFLECPCPVVNLLPPALPARTRRSSDRADEDQQTPGREGHPAECPALSSTRSTHRPDRKSRRSSANETLAREAARRQQARA